MTGSPSPLDCLRIATPCDVGWENMQGDEQVRFCERCHKNVYNLTNLSRRKAETLIIQNEGQLCVHAYRRTDGTILVADCPVGRRAIRQARILFASSVLMVGGLIVTVATILGVPRPTIKRIQNLEPISSAASWLKTPSAVRPPAGTSRSDGGLFP